MNINEGNRASNEFMHNQNPLANTPNFVRSSTSSTKPVNPDKIYNNEYYEENKKAIIDHYGSPGTFGKSTPTSTSQFTNNEPAKEKIKVNS